MNKLVLEAPTKVRTTVDLPSELRSKIHLALDRGMVRSQNALIVQAVERHLHELEGAWIDQQFAAMAEDEVYQDIQLSMLQEFALADQESWQLRNED